MVATLDAIVKKESVLPSTVDFTLPLSAMSRPIPVLRQQVPGAVMVRSAGYDNVPLYVHPELVDIKGKLNETDISGAYASPCGFLYSNLKEYREYCE